MGEPARPRDTVLWSSCLTVSKITNHSHFWTSGVDPNEAECKRGTICFTEDTRILQKKNPKLPEGTLSYTKFFQSCD